ncbi:OmpA family protein [Sanguibacter antarcticus]|uniref:OmpA family protein n=1 Tax=Sanguibacter antarcticus TaxID=372484 RepID=UPI00147558B9|nr:OmpA family protein [Sanguibacter antarcticus]
MHTKRTATVLVLTLLVAGCSAEPERDQVPSPSPSLSPSAGETETVPARTTATFAHGTSTLTVAAHPVAVDGDVAVTTLEVTVPADAEEPVDLGYLLIEDVTERKGARAVRLVDREARTALPVVRDDTVWASDGALTVEPGESLTLHTVHAAPSGEDVDVVLPAVGVVAAVPVVDSTQDDDAALDVDAARDELGGLPTSGGQSYDLRAFTAAYDDQSSVAVEGDDVTLTLTADVLFAADEHVLDPEGTRVVEDVARSIVADGAAGRIVVAGHTDDVDTEEYNQSLSEQRATSVADALRPALSDDQVVETAGYGESRPVAAGTDAAARAANRRVEISFTAAGTASPSVPTAPGASGPPSTDAPTSTDGEPVQVDAGDGSGTYTVGPATVVRTAAGLRGTIEIELVDGHGGAVSALFGEYGRGLSAARGFSAVSTHLGLHELTLLGETERLYPLDYETDSGTRRILGDELLAAGPQAPGDVLTVSVYWPDQGEDVVTIDAPDRFRIVDVPVEDEAR